MRDSLAELVPAGIAFDLAFALLSEEPLRHLLLFSTSSLQTKRRASLFWLEGRARQRTLEGLGQPAQLRCKATPQIDNRVSSCKPRVSVSKVQVLKRQGLQPMADPAGLSAAVLVGEL